MSLRIHPDDLRFLGEHFKRARKRAGLRQVELAKEAGYKNINKGCRRVGTIEAGGAPPSEQVLERFAHTLDVDLDALFEEIEARKEERRQAELERHKPWMARLLCEARKMRGLSVEEVVERAGLEPKKRHASRLRKFEAADYRLPTDRELERLADALDMPRDRAFDALDKECAYYDDLDGTPHVIVRYLPVACVSIGTPRPSSTRDVLEFAHTYAADNDRKVSVVLPDRRSVYIEPDGSRFESSKAPGMVIG